MIEYCLFMGHFGSFRVLLQTVYVCVYTEQQDFSDDVFLGESFGSKVILDVGCRAGSTGISLKKSGFQEIDGVDPAREVVNVARDLGIYRELSIGKIGKDAASVSVISSSNTASQSS